MQDWATFFFTGSSTLPAFMVLVNDEAIGLAILVFVGLLITACVMGLRDQDSPARKAVRLDLDKPARDRSRDEGDRR
ncbi:MAG: hypothetical protein JNL78_08130 [Rhodocyclaceae bacterium]|jgi:hypothetical protein|nr:hypothetical protein [Rhodocyclaceae bacterium]